MEAKTMKKGLLLAAMLTLCNASCFATIPTSELAIGGIITGNDQNYVRSVYGAPTKMEYRTTPYSNTKNDVTYTYGNSFSIRFYNDFALSIISKGNNGISTPSGIHVGSTFGEVKKLYGKPDPSPDRNYFGLNGLICYTDKAYTRVLELKIKKGKVVLMQLSPAASY